MSSTATCFCLLHLHMMHILWLRRHLPFDPKTKQFISMTLWRQSFYDAQEDMLSYDIDVSIDTLQAHAHQQKPPPKPPRMSPGVAFPRMSKDKWFKLSPEACEIWDQLDDHSKSIILAPPQRPSPNQQPGKENQHAWDKCLWLPYGQFPPLHGRYGGWPHPCLIRAPWSCSSWR